MHTVFDFTLQRLSLSKEGGKAETDGSDIKRFGAPKAALQLLGRNLALFAAQVGIMHVHVQAHAHAHVRTYTCMLYMQTHGYARARIRVPLPAPQPHTPLALESLGEVASAESGGALPALDPQASGEGACLCPLLAAGVHR